MKLDPSTARAALFPAAALTRRADPANARPGEDHEMIAQLLIARGGEKRHEKRRGLLGRRRLGFHADHARVLAQRQHCPVAEIAITGDQHARVGAGEREEFSVIRAGLHHLRRGNDIVPLVSQYLCEIQMKHLVEKDAHGMDRLRCGGRENFGVLDCRARVKERRLNVIAGQPRIPAQQILPRFASGDLFEEHLHRDARAANDRLAIANTGIEFDALDGLFHFQRDNTDAGKMRLGNFRPGTTP